MEAMDEVERPTLIAELASHILIGLFVAVISKAIFRRKFVVALMAGLLAAVLHQSFDAPLARELSKLGL